MTFDLNDKAARPAPELVLKGGIQAEAPAVPQCQKRDGRATAGRYCERCGAAAGELCNG